MQTHSIFLLHGSTDLYDSTVCLRGVYDDGIFFSIFAVQRSGLSRPVHWSNPLPRPCFSGDCNRSPKVMARQCRLPNFASEDFAFSLWILWAERGFFYGWSLGRSREPGTKVRYSSRHGKQISWQPKCFAWVKSLMPKPSNSWALKDFDSIPEISHRYHQI